MGEETILNEDGLLSKAASLYTEDSAAYPDDSLLNSEDEFPSAHIQRSMDKPKERQDEQPSKPPNKFYRDVPRGSYEHQKVRRVHLLAESTF